MSSQNAGVRWYIVKSEQYHAGFFSGVTWRETESSTLKQSTARLRSTLQDIPHKFYRKCVPLQETIAMSHT